MWLLNYEEGFYGNCKIVESLLYSTKEKAIAGLPFLMDKHSQYAYDWRNWLDGFGKENYDNYLGLEYFADRIGDEGGDLLTNKRVEARYTITVSLKRMPIDPFIEQRTH